MIIKSKQQKHAKLKKLDCSCYWYFALNDRMISCNLLCWGRLQNYSSKAEFLKLG